MNRPKRPTPPPLSKTERQHLGDLIRRGARALNPTEGNRLLRLLELDQADRQQERRTAGGLMAQVQQLGGQLKDMTARAETAEAALAAVCMEPVVVGPLGNPWGPCVITGPHVQHRDESGTRWARIDEPQPRTAGKFTR